MSDELAELGLSDGVAGRRPVKGAAVSVFGAVMDLAAVLGLALLNGVAYHMVLFDGVGQASRHLEGGLLAGSFYVVATAMAGRYSINAYVSRPRPASIFMRWTYAFAAVLAVGFVMKVSDSYSRGTLILLYLTGIPILILTRLALGHAVVAGARVGIISAKRLFVMGPRDMVAAFVERYRPEENGLHLVATATLAPQDVGAEASARKLALTTDLERAVGLARTVHPDAVVILSPWFDEETLDRCLEELQTVPVEIHLGPDRILERFEMVSVSRIGPLTTLQLTRSPLNAFEMLQKRAFDIVVGSLMLVLLSPFLTLIAIAIKLDSRGPAFFYQRRYGFNQWTFRIVKFRTMTTLDDGDNIKQAVHDDVRVTRVGRFLRRANLDELPQLLNVLRGEMSLIGPRPHAVAHNREYERRIALYARRHNVKPGITGWAQVNGFRGETSDPSMMRRRVEHDLYYIDNWSIWLDIKILLMTIFSRRAYHNAH